MRFFKHLRGFKLGASGRRARRRERGYTLIEILIVLAIIALLVGIATPLVVNQFGEAKVSAARSQLSALANSCELFFLDVGRYPTDTEGLVALTAAPAGTANWKGPYVTKASSLIDPWGRPYLYTTSAGSRPYQIQTLGADGQAGGTDQNADLTNWD